MIRLVYDVGPGIGLGHRARMRALAAALTELGYEAGLAELGDAPVVDDVVVVDSYRTRADGALIRARQIAAIDDLRRDLAIDLVVDPAPTNNGGGPSAARRALRGLQYALVDPKVTAHAPVGILDTVEAVLVTSGGADKEGIARRIASRVRASVPDAEVRLVVGPWSSRAVPDGVRPVDAPDGLVDELIDADVVVTAAGVTVLESLALGRPTITFMTAENQRRYFEGLAVAGALIATTPDAVAKEASRLASDVVLRRRLAATAHRTVDGHGAARVAEAIVQLA